MTPTQEDHEAAADRALGHFAEEIAILFTTSMSQRHNAMPKIKTILRACVANDRMLYAAALSEAVRVAPAHSDDSGRESDATKHAKDCLCPCHKTDAAHISNVGCQRALMEEAVRVALSDARDALQFYGRHTRGESDGCGWLKGGPCTCGLEAAIIAAGWTSDAQATPAPECRVCRTQDSGLPTPGYSHDRGCTRGTPPETGEKEPSR